MRLISHIVIISTLPLILCAQVENEQNTPVVASPLFFLDGLSFWGNDSLTRFDVFVQVPHSELHYVSGEKGFDAKYEVTANVLNADGHSMVERIWSETVHAADFDATTSKKLVNTTQRSLMLKMGKYALRVQVHDEESRKTSILLRDLAVDGYGFHPFSVSDIMLANAAVNEGGRTTISPNISGNMMEAENGFFIFYEVYAKTPTDSIGCTYRIMDQTGHVAYAKSERRACAGNRTQVIAHIDSSRFPIGAYVLEVEITTAGRLSVIKRRGLTFQWSDLPVTIADLDLAIRQLLYIATEEEADAFKAEKTYEQKKELFLTFWRRRDPSPDSKRNEFMEEYYARVKYANAHFKHFLEGWRTDMGMVFVMFGAPNNVDRHPFDYDAKPYEVWAYYDYNTQLIFVDGTGFGDYRLITPIWDMLHRLKIK